MYSSRYNGELFVSKRTVVSFLTGFALSAFLMMAIGGNPDYSHQYSPSHTRNLELQSPEKTQPTTRLAAKAAAIEGASPFEYQPCGVKGLRVMIAIASFGSAQSHYMEDMIDSLRDMCEAGLKVTLVLYKTQNNVYSVDEALMLTARMQCRNPWGSFRTQVVYRPQATKLHFAEPHREAFFQHADDYDLFVYSEDDHGIRLRHVLAYLDETAKLKGRVGQENFLKYSVGFIRYEVDPKTKARTAFEHDGQFPILPEVELEGRYFTTPGDYHHQGMYMATREQLLGWKENCPCFADPSPFKTRSAYREFMSSVCLFMFCKVVQVIPRDSFQDFAVHHMSDKYLADDREGDRLKEIAQSLLDIFTHSAQRSMKKKEGNGFVTNLGV